VSVSGEFALVRDGGQVLIRPLAPDDRAGVAALFARLSPESRALRFHSGGIRIDDRTLESVTAGHALVVERDGRIVALASYYPLRDPVRAEMAIAVDDAAHGRGIGTVLFERLSEDARRAGIRTLLAEVLAANRGMLGLLTGLGFRTSRRFDGGVVEVDVALAPDPAYRARADARLHVAASASLEPIFRPRAVAVIGAARRAGAPGHELFRHLLAGGFAGAVYPVNPAASAVASVRAYPTVAAIPEPIDLAVIAVPAPAVLEAARACLDAGVRGLIVVSAGFAEAGDEGRRRQDALLRLCRERGARLIGPHSMGVLVNAIDGGALNATFAPALPPRGAVAISAQSGVLGLALLEHARRLGLGVSAFVSLGAKADVSSNDLLERWEDDPATGVILLYLESFGNPRRFARIARRVGARTPILAVKGGRAVAVSDGGNVAHTAALTGTDVAVDALFRQSGVTRCDTLDELFDAALLLASQPLPRGNHVGILTNVSGLGVLCADACVAAGLELPVPSETTQTALRAFVSPRSSHVANPIDLPTTGATSDYAAALCHLLADAAIDAVIALFLPPLGETADAVAAALRAACDPPPTKPVLCCFAGVQGLLAAPRGAVTLPSYTYPEAAARALGHAAARAAWLRRAAGQIPPLPGIDSAAGRAVVDRALAREERPWLGPDEVRDVLRAYGVTMPAQMLVHTPAEAADACRRLGAPVAVKATTRGALHTSDVGDVRLAVATPAAAATAYRDIEAALAARGRGEAMDGALVQSMAPDGMECLVGVVTDPVFGPLVAFGLGGVVAEVIGDVAFRVHPLTDVDADELIASVKASRLLQGYGGRPSADVHALRDVLLRVSRLVEDVPEIDEIAINPIMVRDEGQGAEAIDARIRLRRGDA